MKPLQEKTLLLVGMTIFILALMTGLFIFTLGQRTFIFGKSIHLFSHVDNTHNLRQGAAVHLRGIRVGVIKGLRFISYNRIEVEFSVSDSYAQLVKRDSSVLIHTLGLMGDKYLEITGGTDKAPAVREGEILKMGEVLAFEDLLAGQGTLGRDVKEMAQEMKTLIRDLNRKRHLSRTLSNLAKLTAELNTLTKQLQAISSRIQTGPGTFHSLIYDDSLHTEARYLLQGAQRNRILQFFLKRAAKESDKLEGQRRQINK